MTTMIGAFLLLGFILIIDFKYANGRDFTYNGNLGPDHWGEQYNACGGKHQSPININVLDVVEKQFLPLYMKIFDKIPKNGELLNNGHTVVVNLDFDDDTPTITDGPLNGDVYKFLQFHFHWGENNTVGSEDRINNKTFPAELHMVFRNSNPNSTQNSELTVLAFFFELQDEDNLNYVEFTNLLKEIPMPGTKVEFRNPPRMMDLMTKNLYDYYTYTGSLTTPPCSEDVTWIDFATPIMISTNQIDSFRHLLTHDGSPLTHNFRPIQPLNNRTIYRASKRSPPGAIPFVDIENNGNTFSTQYPIPVLSISLTMTLMAYILTIL